MERVRSATGEFVIRASEGIVDANFHSRGDRGGSEEPTDRRTLGYVDESDGSDSAASCKDNEGIHVKGNWHQDAIAMLPF